MRDETFGPVIGVQRVRDDAEAMPRTSTTRSSASARRCSPATGRAPSASSHGSTSATPTGTRPIARASGCRGRAAATRASACRCPSPACAPSSARRPGTSRARRRRSACSTGNARSCGAACLSRRRVVTVEPTALRACIGQEHEREEQDRHEGQTGTEGGEHAYPFRSSAPRPPWFDPTKCPGRPTGPKGGRRSPEVLRAHPLLVGRTLDRDGRLAGKDRHRRAVGRIDVRRIDVGGAGATVVGGAVSV